MFSFAQLRKDESSQWHHVRLDAGQLDQREDERMKLLFNSAYMAAHWPRGMTLWQMPDNDGGADIYLSPQSTPWADELIGRYNAQAGGPPPIAAVAVAGDKLHNTDTRHLHRAETLPGAGWRFGRRAKSSATLKP